MMEDWEGQQEKSAAMEAWQQRERLTWGSQGEACC